ncbi:MAG: hypothetical protein Q9168_003958 [Polycauliona sp. 1 TL-2023]
MPVSDPNRVGAPGQKLLLTLMGLTEGTGDAAALHGKCPMRLPDKNSLSDSNTARIHGWLDNCMADHACCRTKKLPRLPTRIIDVGSLGDRGARLLETNRRPAQYLALSHCWGAPTASKTNLRLLQSNFQDLLTEIPTKSISKNFQDAIEVARKLKFRYLWIDALCIIQDSKHDWEIESARMNDVYESAHLTIVATSAVSSDEGFLKRPTQSVVTLPYRIKTDPSIEGRFYITRSIAGGDIPWNLVEKTAWNTRGWTSTTRKVVLDYWAPSWSWASIAGTVHWPTRSTSRHKRDDFAVQFLENHLKLAPESTMGSVLGGYIRLRGRLRRLSCTTRPLEWGDFMRFRYDLWGEGDTLVGNGQFDVDRDDTAEEVWLLQMKVQEAGDWAFPYHPTALMLERLSGSLLSFVRLGCAALDEEKLDFFDGCEPQDFDFY